MLCCYIPYTVLDSSADTEYKLRAAGLKNRDLPVFRGKRFYALSECVQIGFSVHPRDEPQSPFLTLQDRWSCVACRYGVDYDHTYYVMATSRRGDYVG